MQEQFVLKAKVAIKRVAAMSTGALMLGATALGGVAAYDLGDYPAPFVADGVWGGLVVVGSGANAADIVGATDIIGRLTQEAVSPISGTGIVAVEGGKTKEMTIGYSLNDSTYGFGAEMDDSDISTLGDAEVNIDIGSDKDYDYRDIIKLDANAGDGAAVHTAITSATYLNDDWKSDTFLVVPTDGLRYEFRFDESLGATNNFTAATTDNPIELNFLGQDLKITAATATTVTAEVGTNYFLTVGDTVDVDGKTMKLVNVASTGTTVVVDVDGVQETVTTTSNQIGTSGVKVKALSTFYSDTLAERSAKLLVGTETTKTYTTGDAYIGEDEDDPDWVWYIAGLDGIDAGDIKLGVEYDNIINGANDAYISVENQESICFPNDFVCLKLDSYTTDNYKTYTFEVESGVTLYNNTAAVSADTGGDWGSTNADVIHITADGIGKNGFNIAGASSTETDDIYLYFLDNDSQATPTTTDKVGVYYKDHSNSNRIEYSANSVIGTTGEIFRIVHGDATYYVSGIGTDHGIEYNMTIAETAAPAYGTANAIELHWGVATADKFDFFGHSTQDTTKAEDLQYAYAADTFVDISAYEDDVRTKYGVIIQDPGSNGPSDQVVLEIPDEQADFKINVLFTGKGGTTSTTGGSVQINSIAGVDLVKLDTEVTDKTSKPMIIVGGPAINPLAAEALGLTYPAYGAASGIPEGKALIQLVENAFGGTNVALVVAGWDAANTREATTVLKNFDTYFDQLTGKMKVQVSGTSVTAVTETAAVDAADDTATA
jgi:hypothetical protein